MFFMIMRGKCGPQLGGKRNPETEPRHSDEDENAR